MHQASSIGGGSYCLMNIVKALDNTKWEPMVALKSHGQLEDELSKMGVKVVLFPQMMGIPYNLPLTLRNFWTYCQVWCSEKACEELLRREQIDVLYLNNMMIAPYLLPAKKAGCKTVMHVREHWPLNEHKKQLEWVRRIVYENCDKLIAINQYSASIFPEKEVTIVYDWNDMNERYKPMPLSDIFCEDMNGKTVLLYTGGAQSIKGTDYILKSFCDGVKGDNYRLLILGISELRPLRGWKHNVKMFLSRFGYYYYDKILYKYLSSDRRIKYIPAVYDLSHIIEQSSCFVSYFRIPHANLALVENIILGNPCIVGDTEEAREYSGDGKYAKLVAPLNDLQAFGKALVEFLQNLDNWRDAANRGSQMLAARFDRGRNTTILNFVLSEVVNNKTN